jgi:hypothetical protein
MKLKSLYVATAAALLAFSSAAFTQTQSGSSIRSDSGMSGSASGKAAAGSCDHLAGAERAQCLSDSASGGGTAAPSTGTSADTAGAAGTTAPRSSDTTSSSGTTSVGTSGASSGASAPIRSSGLCDTLIGDERMKCLKEQAATGTTR